MPRPLYVIAAEIMDCWRNINQGAAHYVMPMRHMHSINDSYGLDKGRDVVLRFLCNAEHWRGDHARRIKAELKQMLKG